MIVAFTGIVIMATSGYVWYANIMTIAPIETRMNKQIVAPQKRYASIHPFNRQMEWKCKKHKMDWLHEDVCPTVTANEFRGVGNVIWEVYESDDLS